VNPYMADKAVEVKIRTKQDKFFDEGRIEELLSCENIDQVTDFLITRHDLGRIAGGYGAGQLLRDDIETLLKRYGVISIEEILHYFSGPYKEFVKVFLMKYEITDLIMILRRIARGDNPAGTEERFVHSVKYSSLDYGRLTAAKSVAQFIDSLRHSPYYGALRTVTENDVIKREFHMEMKLLLLYYSTLLKKAEDLEPDDKAAAIGIIGEKIDYLNVQWIYRAKKFYGIPPEQILVYCLHGGRHLGFGRLKSMSYAASADKVMQMSDSYLRRSIFENGYDSGIRKQTDRLLFEMLKKSKRGNRIGTIIAYIYMHEIVVNDMISITEGIRYKLPKEQIRGNLVRIGLKAGVKQQNGN